MYRSGGAKNTKVSHSVVKLSTEHSNVLRWNILYNYAHWG